jgi:CheY-like chemotaxis protein
MKSNKPILIVDDDQDIRESIAAALEVGGYRVIQAQNGKAALDLLLSLREHGELPRCILLDLMMPVMTGEEFLQALRQDHPDLQEIPVVVASANGSLSSANLPARKVMKKPIDLRDLYRIAEQFS